MRKVFAVGVVLLGLGLVSIAGAYLYLDFAGKRSWRELESRLRDLGEPLTVADIDPGPISDDENLAAAPIFAETFAEDLGQSRLAKIENFRGVQEAGASEVAKFARRVDPEFSGTDAQAARVVLATVAGEELVWDEVREAAQRPRVGWPVDYTKGIWMDIPQVTPMLRLAQSLNVQARAHLVLGDTAAALADLELLVNLAERNREPRILICHLIRLTMLSLVVDAVGFGIDGAAWTDGELLAIQENLSELDLMTGLVETLRGERVLALIDDRGFDAESVRESAEFLGDELDLLAAADVLDWGWLRPDGLIFEDRARWAGLMQELIEGAQEPREWPERASALKQEIAAARSNPVQFFRTPVSLTGNATVIAMVRRTIHFQSRIDLAVVACAIERFRWRNGRLPEALGVLVPDFLDTLPVDLISGDVFRYRAGGDGDGGGGGEFLLYSVGWNQVDDGGSSEQPTPLGFVDAEDWVWGAW